MAPVDEMTIASIDEANAAMAKAWDGEEGERWARDADLYDSTSIQLWQAFLATNPIAAGDDVLDIGCGCGKSTRDAARLADGGSVLAVDLSSQMLELARRRTREEGLANVRYRQADAQVYPLDEAAFDVAISCFGAMFFADPVAAFTNIGRALRPGGRLAMLSWRSLADNEWMLALRDALSLGRSVPEPPVSAPGPFGLADPVHVRAVLDAAGFLDIAIEALDRPLLLGADADAAFDFVRRMGIVKGLTQDLDEADRQRALDAVHQLLRTSAAEEGVQFGGGAWLTTARR